MKRLLIVIVALVLAAATVAAGASTPERATASAEPAMSGSESAGPPEDPGRPEHAPVPDHAGRPVAEDPDDGDDPAEDGLRLNDLQVRGTHNSTHLDPKGVITDHPTFGWGYSHRTLTAQFEEQDVRQVELDVHYNWAKDDFDVYHVWFGDDRVTCDTLSGCLAEIEAWSDAHPDSAPIMVLVEPKDSGLPYSLAEGSTDPEAHLPEDGDPFTRPFDAHAYDRLDEVLLDSFGGPSGDGGRVLTPDDVTTEGKTLRDSIVEDGWPLLDGVRGHVVFVMDGPDHADPYSQGWTSLAGRSMFVQAEPDQPVAAFVGRDGARLEGESKYDRMARVVAAGFMVRDLASPDGFAAAMAAGAHFISTDFPEDLHLNDDAGAPARCNPVTIGTSGRACTDRAVETHEDHDFDVPEDPSDDYDQVVADEVDRLVVGSAESLTALAEAGPGERTP